MDLPTTQVIIFENLGIKKITKKPKAKQDASGKYLPNHTFQELQIHCENCEHTDHADLNAAKVIQF